MNRLWILIKRILQKEEPKTENEIILENLLKAKEEWKKAELFFQNVTEPELIDYYIYKLDAALEKYTYLIRLAKERGIKSKWTIMK